MTAVYVLRHPQTTWNVEERYQGRLEAPLSPEGRRQARQVAKAFAPGDLDAIYSSPLLRARDLARAIVEATGSRLYFDNRLTELGLGCWEGLHVSEIRQRYPALYDEWYLRPDTISFPHGESLAAVRDRSQSALADVFARHPEGNVALVTHSAVVQVLVASALSLDLRHIHQLRISNAAITTLCGIQAPGSVLSINATESLYHSPVASAAAQQCIGWKPRRIAS